jgi:hypothetical protein
VSDPRAIRPPPIRAPGSAIEILPAGKGHVVAWSAPWGAAAMVIRRFAQDAERHAILLGTLGRTRGDAPKLFHLALGVGALWCEDDGAWIAVLRDDGTGFEVPPRRVLEGARSVCIAAGRSVTHAFAEDGEAIHAMRIDQDGVEHVDAPLLEQTGAARICAARAGESPLLFAIYGGDPRLVVIDGGGGRSSVVRHELRGDRGTRDIDAYGVGSRALFVRVPEGGETVESMIVDAAGKTTDRLDVLIRQPGAHFTHARATWIEDDFHVVARDARHDRAELIPHQQRRSILSIASVAGDLAVAYHAKRLVLAQAYAEGDAPIVRLYSATVAGREAQTIELRQPVPEPLRRARSEERALRCIEELEAALGSAGYRDARGTRVTTASGAALRLATEGQEIEVRPEGEGFVVALVALSGGDPPAVAEDSFERLARWVRQRLSNEARRRADEDRAIARELASALGGELARAERSERGTRIEITLREPPSGTRLAAWLRAARTRLTHRGESR